MDRTSHMPSLVAIFALAGQVGGFRPAAEGTLRSADGRVTITLGSEVANPSPPTVQFVTLPDDGPEAVRGTHYRITAVNQDLKWPAQSRLWISWAPSDAPGGARPGDLVLMRRAAAVWVALEGPESDVGHAGGVLRQGGEYELRWRPSHPCTGRSVHAIDFRIGLWDVRAAGYDPGRATVTADPSGCAIFEHYVDVKGGRSDGCFLLGADGVWYETVIDPSGRAILKGAVESNGIAFYRSPVDREVYRRGPNATVVFTGERSSDAGNTWTRSFTSTFSRVASGG